MKTRQNCYNTITLQASFSEPSLQYHVICKVAFPERDLGKIKELAIKAFEKEEESLTNDSYMPIPLRIVTRLIKILQ